MKTMSISKIKSGQKLKARRRIPYMMGQISSDKIRYGETVTVDQVLTNGKITLVEHADRYGPWYIEDFSLIP
jgi:hypothetical protein